MPNQAQLNQVYQLLQAELLAGQVTRQEIRDRVRDFGLSYKPGWANANALGIRHWLATENVESRQRRALQLTWPAYHLLHALVAGAHTLVKQRQASGPSHWLVAVNELEQRGLISVLRKAGDPRKLTLTEKGQTALNPPQPHTLVGTETT